MVISSCVLRRYMQGFRRGVGKKGCYSMITTMTMITVALSIITTTMTSVANAVMYHDLRTEKEGLGTEEIASIFD